MAAPPNLEFHHDKNRPRSTRLNPHALAHASTLIGCAEATAWDVVDHLHLNDKALVLGLIQQLDSAQALIGAVLDPPNIR